MRNIVKKAREEGDVSTVEAVYKLIRDDIVSGARAPDELLRIDRMRRIYGVGPTPLRETLQRLTAEGLVIARDGRGFQVAPLSDEEFVDLNIARTEIELAALRLAIESGDDAWEARIVAAAYVLEKADNLLFEDGRGNIARWEAANAEFHAALVGACPSTWLLRTREALLVKCERYRRQAMVSGSFQRNIFQEHKDIAGAVLARDSHAAGALLRRHYERTVDNFRNHARARRPDHASRDTPRSASADASGNGRSRGANG